MTTDAFVSNDAPAGEVSADAELAGSQTANSEAAPKAGAKSRKSGNGRLDQQDGDAKLNRKLRPPRTIGIIVAGMHRSGTSALTRALGLLGAQLPAELLGATPFNTSGHWESSRIYDLHNELLRSIDSSWDDWSAIDEDWFESPACASYAIRIAEYLCDDFGGVPLFVIKDPRICRLLPLWRRAFALAEVDPKVVIPLRNPLDVVASLKQRDRMSTYKASLVWLRHVLEAERGSRGVDRVVVEYNGVLDDWRASLKAVGAELGLTWPRWTPAAEREIDRFLDPGLRHHSSSAERLRRRQDLPRSVCPTYEAFEGLNGPDRALVMGRLDHIREDFDRACRTLGPILVDEVKTAVEAHRADRSELCDQLAEARSRLEAESRQNGHEIERLTSEAAARNAVVEALDAEVQTLRTSIFELNAGIAERELQADERIAALRAEADAAQRLAQSAQSALGDAEGRLAESARLVEEHRARAQAASDELGTQRQEAEAISGRLQAALDELGAQRQEAEGISGRLQAALERSSKLADGLQNSRSRRGDQQARLDAREIELEQLSAEHCDLQARFARLESAASDAREDKVSKCWTALKEAGRIVARTRRSRQSGRTSPVPNRNVLRAEILASGLFDKAWYLRSNPEVALAGRDPIDHYLAVGASSGFDPHPLFNTEWYRRANAVGTGEGENPLVHFMREGGRTGASPHILFDSRFYLAQNRDVAEGGGNPLEHYLKYGWREGRVPHPRFDPAWYLARYPDVAAAKVNPLLHYVKFGRREGRALGRYLDPASIELIRTSGLFDVQWYKLQCGWLSARAESYIWHYLLWGERAGLTPNSLFDPSWYYECNQDVAQVGVNALYHFITDGGREGRSPHPLFDAASYLRANPDVVKAGANPLAHFLRFGWREGRTPHEYFDCSWYLQTYPGVEAAGGNPLLDYLQDGWRLGRSPHPEFDTSWYLRAYADVRDAGLNPLVHFIRSGANEGRLPREDAKSPGPTRQAMPTAGFPPDRGGIPKVSLQPKLDAPLSTAPVWSKRIPTLGKLEDSVWSPHEARDLIGGDCTAAIKAVPLKVSVIMPTWNRAHVIGGAIDSVLAQSYAAYELIIIDDGSSDGTPDFIRSRYGQAISEGRIILVVRPHEGLALARNAGLERVRGELVAYLDSDNQWHEEFLFCMVSQFSQCDSLGSAYCVEEINDHGRGVRELLAQPFLRQNLLSRNFIDLNCFMHRTSLVPGNGGFDPAMTRLLDWEFIIRVTTQSPAAYVPIQLVHYNLDEDRLQNVTYTENWNKNWDYVTRKHRRERIKAGAESLRVGYVIWDWPALSQTFVMNELRWLLGHGVDVIVYFKTEPDLAIVPDFLVKAHKVDTAEELAALLERDQRNILHSPFAYPATTLLTWPAAQLTKTHFTFMPAGVDICHEKNRVRNRVAEVASDPLCIGLITLGSFHRRLLTNAGVPESKLIMERQAAGLPSFQPKQGRSGSRPRVVSIGRFIEKKGLTYLVKVAQRSPEADFVLYGYGPLEEELRQQVKTLGLKNVFFPGVLKDPETLHAAYREADVFVLPCVEAENGDMDGLPTVVLEAMAAGVPVVTTSLANIPDLIIDSVNGFLAEPRDVDSLGDALSRALSLSGPELTRLLEIARDHAHGYASEKRMMRTLVDCWRARSIDIVLVTYDTPDYDDWEKTREIIDRIYQHTTMPFALTIVDNNSQASFRRELVARYGKRDNFRLIELSENVMAGPGTNIGIDAGSSEYIVYICSKEGFVLQNGWEWRMVQAMDENPRAAMGGYLISLPRFRNGEEYAAYPSFSSWREQEFAANNPDRRFRHVQGGVLIIRRSAYEAVGGFSTAVPHDGTDIEYSYYLEAKGYELLDIPNIYSISSKTLPGPDTLFNENALIMHALTPEAASRFDQVVNRHASHCNQCGWQGQSFDDRSCRAICPACRSTPFTRFAMRFLSLSGVLQRRPRLYGIGDCQSLISANATLCPGSIMLSAETPADAARAIVSLDAKGAVLILDHLEMTPGDAAALAKSVAQFVANGGRAILGESVASLAPAIGATLLDELRDANVVLQEIRSFSSALSLDSAPVVGAGFPVTRECGLADQSLESTGIGRLPEHRLN